MGAAAMGMAGAKAEDIRATLLKAVSLRLIHPTPMPLNAPISEVAGVRSGANSGR